MNNVIYYPQQRSDKKGDGDKIDPGKEDLGEPLTF